MPEYQYYPLADEQIRLLKLFPAQERTAVLEGNLLIRKLHANDRITEVEHPLPVVETDDISILATEFQPSSQNEWDQASRDARTVTTPDHVQGAEQYEGKNHLIEEPQLYVYAKIVLSVILYMGRRTRAFSHYQDTRWRPSLYHSDHSQS